MPKQWKLITLYMLLAYLAFVACIEIARHQVIAEEESQHVEKPVTSPPHP